MDKKYLDSVSKKRIFICSAKRLLWEVLAGREDCFKEKE